MGRKELIEAANAALEALRDNLANEPAIRRIEVLECRVLLFDEHLKTRMVEMVVHVEDLALSIEARVVLPVDTIKTATDTMVAAGRMRHGDLDFLREMTRRERDDVDATRVI